MSLSMKKINFLTLLFVFFLALSCDEEEKEPLEYTESMSRIVETGLPESAELNKKISFIVRHQVNNGCGLYSRHETLINGREVTVTFFAKYPLDPVTVCTDDLPIRSTYYKFTPTLTGLYTFRFREDGEEFLTAEMEVN